MIRNTDSIELNGYGALIVGIVGGMIMWTWTLSIVFGK